MADRADVAALVVEDADAARLAADLVRLTGASLATVVTDALRQELDRVERRAQLHEQIMAITRDIAGGRGMAGRR